MNMDGFMDLMATQIRANASDKNVDSLSAQTIQFLLDSFRMFDQDKDGYLNEAEIKVLNSNTNNSHSIRRHNKPKLGGPSDKVNLSFSHYWKSDSHFEKPTKMQVQV